MLETGNDLPNLILPLAQFLLQTAQEFVFLALGIEKIVLRQLGILLLESTAASGSRDP
jgi:hypothetical protein